MDGFYYKRDINDFGLDKVKKILEHISNPNSNYSCGFLYKKASTTCEAWRVTKRFCKDELNWFTKGQGCNPPFTVICSILL